MRRVTPRSRRGNALLEISLCLPMLLGLFSGVVDYGWYYFLKTTVSDAVRDGARIGVSAGAGEDPVLVAQSAARRVLLDGGFPDVGRVKIRTEVVKVMDAWSVSVTLEYPYVPLAGLFPSPSVLRMSRTMMLERQDLAYYGY